MSDIHVVLVLFGFFAVASIAARRSKHPNETIDDGFRASRWPWYLLGRLFPIWPVVFGFSVLVWLLRW
jgi:hypothetical protein